MHEVIEQIMELLASNPWDTPTPATIEHQEPYRPLLSPIW